ncbi:MAG: hypothetical protein LBL82_06080 [Oscillospiraceae bacterium]|jgi:N-methylhydantoinase B/oxoprolinase/acetone carboxylase alpha subunit|nr:hypothetical protein [Oscillospiraceae bacterium]
MQEKNEMQYVLTRIIEADKKARADIDAAVAASEEAEQSIDRRVEQLRAEYMQNAMAEVEAIRQAETRSADEKWAAIEKCHAEIASRLEAQLREKGDEWADQIVSRVIGG